jgi:tetratricopeptide (TPR) repeat protein
MSSSRQNNKRIYIPRRFRWLLSLLLIGIFAGCTTSKSLSKKAVELEAAGLYNDAATFYYNALLKNSTNIDARIGLSKTGQRVLNDKLDDFTKARAMEEYKDAVDSYRDAMDYRTRVERLGIKLEAPAYLADDYEEAKELFIKELYKAGNEKLNNKDFDGANKIFKEIAKLDPNYKDIKDLKNVSRNEPIYLAATEEFDNGNFRAAYYEFDKIYEVDPNYKDVAILRDESLDKGKFPVAIVPFENASNQAGIEKRVQAYVVSELSALDDPFLRIIERENLELILKEQRLNLSGVVNEATAAQVGNLLGASAILTGTILSYNSEAGKMKTTTKKAYEAYQVKLYNRETDRHYYETRYKPVNYSEFYNQNEVVLSVQYKLVSLESGEVLFSDVVERTVNSTVYYAKYPGEITRLFPASSDGNVSRSRSDRNRLLELMRAGRELKSVETLTNEAYEEAAKALGQKMKQIMRNQ